MSIETKEDWWKLLEKNWERITEKLPLEFGWELGTEATDDMTPSGKPLGISVYEILDNARLQRNHDPLLRYFNAFWMAAPDQPWIHSIPGWGALCDLCSESWVFEEAQ